MRAVRERRRIPADAAGTIGMARGACLHCRCNARQRAAAMVLLDAIETPAQARVYATEQASPLYVALRRRMPRLRGSEFAAAIPAAPAPVSLWLCRHGVLDWIHREDATRLHFRDAGLDAVLSLDVLEHVSDYPLPCANSHAYCARMAHWC
jgi:hypothetical protein